MHVVNVEKIFPGVKITKPPSNAPGFKTANGGRVPNKGSAIVPFMTQEGQKRRVQFTHADVEMPILSTNELSRNNGELRYREHDGTIVNLISKEETAFVASGGVYFLKMLVPKKLLHDEHEGSKQH